MARPGIDLFLQPGEYAVGGADYRLRTLLGSCVAITLWHRERRIGAMCHFLLPSRHSGPAAALDGRYGGEVVPLMIQQLQRSKIDPQHCEAKIFGGADMLGRLQRRGKSSIGHQNGEAARSLLSVLGIPIVAEHLYGCGHRNVIFDVSTGHVWCRQVPAHSALEGAA